IEEIGLSAGVSGPNRCEVNGADAALAFIRGKGLSDRRAQLIWDLIALNSTPSLALHKEPEVVVGTMGIGVDYGGFGVQALPAGGLGRLLSALPRLEMKQHFSDACCPLFSKKTRTSFGHIPRALRARGV